MLLNSKNFEERKNIAKVQENVEKVEKCCKGLKTLKKTKNLTNLKKWCKKLEYVY